MAGKKSLSFESLLRGVFCMGVVDSGATHSFLTKAFCDKHNLSYTSAATHALLADSITRLPIVGVMWNASFKLHSFSCKQSLSVLDSSSCDIVIGMDWLEEHDPVLSFRKRRMRLQPNKGPSIVLPAVARDPLPHHPNVEVCSAEAIARELRQRSDISEEGILVAVLQHTPVEPTHGKVADSSDIAPLLADFPMYSYPRSQVAYGRSGLPLMEVPYNV